jgi:two-component system, chemotaxis family, CheB/CheR fusion protein
VHIHGRTGAFLEPAPGPQVQPNIYQMAREGLGLDLAVAVRRASESDGEIVQHAIRVVSHGHPLLLDLRVRRLTHPEALRGLFMITFESRPSPDHPVTDGPRPEGDRLQTLEHELEVAKEVHQSTVEELQTSNEELKSTNEELQSANEELQSANEELETSKEEMQSLNEELQTVNAELQSKVEELSRTNDDMKNLLNSTSIGTLFLDNNLNIKRYTEQAKLIIRLIPSDVGRPVGDLVSKLHYDGLVDDAREVLRTLVFKEREVQGQDGAWYLMRILPYRTMENVIDGLVVTFVDTTKIKSLQEEARRVLDALRSSPTSLFGQSKDLVYQWVFGRPLGRHSEDVVGRTDGDLFTPEDAAVLMAVKRQALEQGAPVRRRLNLKVRGVARTVDLFVDPQRDGTGQVVGLTGVLSEFDDEATAT